MGAPARALHLLECHLSGVMEGEGDDTHAKDRVREEGGASVFVTPCLLVAATLACALSQLGVDLAEGLTFTVGLFLLLDFLAFRWVCLCVHVCMCRDGGLCTIVVEWEEEKEEGGADGHCEFYTLIWGGCFEVVGTPQGIFFVESVLHNSTVSQQPFSNSPVFLRNTR